MQPLCSPSTSLDVTNNRSIKLFRLKLDVSASKAFFNVRTVAMSLDTIVACNVSQDISMHEVHGLLNAVEVSTSISSKMYPDIIRTIIA